MSIIIIVTFFNNCMNTGRTPGDSNVLLMDLTSVDVARSRACASINLIHNTTYYSTLTVFNSAMNMQSTSVSSDGGRSSCMASLLNIP